MPQPTIIKLEQYDEIRDRLGNIPEHLLPNSVIERLSYLQRAEEEVKERVPGWEAVLSDGTALQKIYLKVAVIAFCAYHLTFKVQQLLKSEDISDYRYVALSPDEWNKIRAGLLEEGNENVGSLVEVPATTLMALSGPGRACAPCSDSIR
jgi:hypothetical protein